MKAKIAQREADIGRKFDGIHIQYWGGGSYQGQDKCIDSGTIGERREQWIHDRGAMPIVTWSPDKTIAEVNSGAVDACFAVAANHFKSYGFPIMLRMWWEFDNGDVRVPVGGRAMSQTSGRVHRGLAARRRHLPAAGGHERRLLVVAARGKP